MPGTWEGVTTSPEETQRVAQRLGAACSGGELFLLVGGLGAGKTCFIQGLAQGLDVRDYVHSPTFVMVAQYQGRHALCHVDLYRVGSADEAVDLGLDEYLTADSVGAVEWADRAPACFPPERLLATLTDLGGDRRRICLEATDPRHQALLAAVASAHTRGKR